MTSEAWPLLFLFALAWLWLVGRWRHPPPPQLGAPPHEVRKTYTHYGTRSGGVGLHD